MNIRFSVEYRTEYGQELMLHLSEAGSGGLKTAVEYRMHTDDGQSWHCDIQKDWPLGTVLSYYYSVERGGKTERREWLVVPHRLELTAGGTSYRVYDHWSDLPEDSYLYSSAVSDCLMEAHLSVPQTTRFARTVRLRVRAPQLRKGQRLCVVGQQPALGQWKMERAVCMTEHAVGEWMADIDAAHLYGSQMELKFAAVEGTDFRKSVWEMGDNRTVTLPLMGDGDVVVYDLTEVFLPLDPLRVAGTLVPVFSLRSKSSFGVGDFGDLKKMVDWVALTGQRVLQVLPINDTTQTHTWTDSYPYSCISVFAIHPQYVDLEALPPLADKKTRIAYEQLRSELNDLPQIDYERVEAAKTSYLRLLYAQDGERVMATKSFQQFFQENARWLVPYAQYCGFRDRYGSADFSTWPAHRQWDENDRESLSTPGTKAYGEAAYFYYLQYILFSQMSEVHTYARQKNVILKGDIPIGVNRYGCDVWMEPRYFNLNGQAGAPPDDFSVNGQNWRFPTYNWEEMLRDGCQWWVRRFQSMARFFDAYRIDHVLGFFRIWEIPAHAVHGLLGQFQPALALTREEIESYGLHWQEDLFSTPFITDWVLDRMFHEQAAFVRDHFLERKTDYYYRMKEAFDTQRKVEAFFAPLLADDGQRRDFFGEETTVQDAENLRDGLYALISDVLFVRDHRDPNRFHPRICVQLDFVYESLYDSDKALFNRLYDDYFYRRNDQYWYGEAMHKLPRLVEAARMLVCAEDLGMVPSCVPWVLDALRILSLEVQSMPKDPADEFGHTERFPHRSVCTFSSHDMPTLRQWWDEDWGRTQRYYQTMLHRQGDAPHPLPGWLARDVVGSQLSAPSMLCILSIQDWMAVDEKLRLADADAERINIPSNPRHYWRYRMHVGIEDLMANQDFNANMREMIAESGRDTL